MARALYTCPRCNREWEAMSTMSVRLATGGPVHCQCGEVARLKEVIRVQIGSLKVKTAAEILKHEADWAEDAYHANILSAARALEGSPYWLYHTQWSSGTTLWYYTAGRKTATVEWDAEKGWVVDIQ